MSRLEKPRPVSSMTESERNILKDLGDNYEPAFQVLFLLCQLPYNRKGEVFRYMKKRGIVGQNLMELFQKNQGSPYRLYHAILTQIDGQMSGPLTVKDLQ